MFGSSHIFAIEILKEKKKCWLMRGFQLESGTEKFPFATFLFVRFLAFSFFDMRNFFFLHDERGRRRGFMAG